MIFWIFLKCHAIFDHVLWLKNTVNLKYLLIRRSTASTFLPNSREERLVKIFIGEQGKGYLILIRRRFLRFVFSRGGGGQFDPLPPLLLSFNFIQLLKKQFRIGYIICYMLTSWVTFQQGKGKCQKIQKLLIIVNIGRENRHILWTTWAISMNFSGKMWLMTILKVIYLSVHLIYPQLLQIMHLS